MKDKNSLEGLQKLKNVLVEEFEGISVEDAVSKALFNLKMLKKELKIKVLYEGQQGLFGLKGSKPARIKVMPDFSNIINVIKFYFVKLLSFAKEDISIIEVNLDNNTVNIEVFLNQRQSYRFLCMKEVNTSLYILTRQFIQKILPSHKLILNFKLISAAK
ncbi:MAG: Jag N-terminal domain-containing protein [Endomicrobia bacterium]|nr:Jag N-terminal domain-containing protein [Endomicrobiia bacterium]